MPRLRLVFISLILLTAAAVAGLAYLNESVLPVKARQWAEKAASEGLGRRVSIGRVQIHWWRGFVLEKVAIADDGQFGPQPVLEVDQISGGILFLPILKNREFIVTTLHLVRPRFRLLQNAKGAWNIQTLRMKPAAARPSAPSRFHLLIPHLLLTEGRMEITTRKNHAPLDLYFQNMRMDVRLALPAKVECTASAELQAVPPVPITLQGTYELPQRQFQVKSRSDWTLPVALSHLPEEWQSRVGSLEGTATLNLEASGKAGSPLEWTAGLETKGLRWKKEMEARGDLRIRLEGKIPSPPPPDFWRQLRGWVILDRITLHPVPNVEELRDLSGEIQIDAGTLRTERLTAVVPPNILVEISGSIIGDSQQTVGLRLSSSFPLEQPPPLPTGTRNFIRNTKLTGQANLEILISGNLRPERSLRPSAILTLEGAKAEFPKGCPWVDVRAVLRWQPDLLTVSQASGQFLNRPLELEGTVVDFGQPEIDARLRWGDLSAETQLEVTREKIGIENLTGRFSGGTFRVLGEVTRPESVANLLVESTGRLEQLERIAPQRLAWISKNGLTGEVNARCLIQGNLEKPSALDLNLKLTAPHLSVRKIPLENFSAELDRENGTLEIRSVQAHLAEGTVGLTGTLQESEPKTPWGAQVTLQDLDLVRLGQILEWKNQTISGKLTADWKGTGEGTHAAAVTGNGTLRVAGGQILEFPLLGRFADLVGATALRTIGFQEAQGTFRLTEGKIQTDHFQVTSPQATITVAGWGGFLQGADSPIDWRLVPIFSPEIIPEETRSKIGEVLAKGASYLMGEIRMTGTWKNPKRKFISKPVTRILNEQLFNIQDLLKDLF